MNTLRHPALPRLASSTGVAVRRLAVAAGAALALLACAVHAQSYPSKPIRYIIPFAPGGPSDLMGRAITKEMSPDLGQSIVVENRPGATGVIGLNYVAGSAPDGYTLLQFSNTTSVALYFQGKPFDIDKLMTTIGNFHLGIQMLIVNPNLINVQTLPELIAYLKAHPGTNYTSSGQGSPGNLLIEGMGLAQGFKAVHVGYNGVQPAVTDVIAGRVGLIVTDGLVTKGYLSSGQLRAVSVVSSQHTPLFPRIPTSTEQGMPDAKNDALSGLVGPPGMQEPVVQRLQVSLKKAAGSESFKTFVAGLGNVSDYIDGPDFRAALLADYQHWGKVIHDAGIKAE